MFEQAFKNIDDVLWKEGGCTTELDYLEQTSRLLFLKYLDGLEQDKADEAALVGKRYTFIDKPYRWEQWAAPKGKSGQVDHSQVLTGEDLREIKTVDAKSIDPATFDLSVKNPNGSEEVVHCSPEDSMDEIAALDAESAEVLQTIRGLL